eukprot:7350224-Ditylum_brightwellii.AAC.1
MEYIDTTYLDNLEGKMGVGSTTVLIGSSVPSLPLCLIPQRNTSMGVHNNRLLDEKTIFVETCHIPLGVSKGDLIDLIGVEPDLTLSTFEYKYCKALLQSAVLLL